MLAAVAQVARKAAGWVTSTAIAMAMLLPFTVFAHAQGSRLKNIELCNGADRTSSEPRIRGCTALILSDGEPARIRSVAYNNRGNAYVADGAYDRAIEDFGHAIGMVPNYAKAFNNRAVAYGKKGQHGLALRDLDEALRIDPGYATAFENRAEINFATGQFARAAQDYGEAIRLRPGFAAWRGRCQARAAIGELQAAAADCTEALKLERDAAAFDMRALINLRLGQWDAALSDYDMALRLEPGRATALFGRGLAYSRMGMTSQAEADFAAAKSVLPAVAKEFARYGVK